MKASAAKRAIGIAVLPMTVTAVWLSLSSDHLERPVVTGVYYGYLTSAPMVIGLYWWTRRPASRFGPLLVAFGVSAWVVSWQSSDWPLVFDVGVLGDAALILSTFWLFLGFPSGRLDTLANRLVIGVVAVTLGGFFLPWALLSPVIAGGGPLAACLPACPQNVLQIATAPHAVEVLGRWEEYIGLGATVAVLIVYVHRLATASRPRRRALVAVASTSLLFLPAFFAFHYSYLILEVDPSTLHALGWVVLATRILLPLGFLFALLQADLFAGTARARLLEQLLTRPSPDRWQAAVAEALDDPGARIGYWDPESSRYRDAEGQDVEPASARAGCAWVPADRGGDPIAAMLIDETLAEDPELVRAAALATVLAVENGNLEGELRASRERIVAAGDDERRRIERDLHDSAQQRLVALRIHLSMASQMLEGVEHRAMVEGLGEEVEEALAQVRNVARGVYPHALSERGVAAALRSVVRNAGIPVTLDDGGLGRHQESTELAMYFSILEALQNVAKHAGPGSAATVRLDEEPGWALFTVADDGVGFEPRTVGRGAGLTNIADRVEAAGGALEVESGFGRGTSIRAKLPV